MHYPFLSQYINVTLCFISPCIFTLFSCASWTYLNAKVGVGIGRPFQCTQLNKTNHANINNCPWPWSGLGRGVSQRLGVCVMRVLYLVVVTVKTEVFYPSGWCWGSMVINLSIEALSALFGGRRIADPSTGRLSESNEQGSLRLDATALLICIVWLWAVLGWVGHQELMCSGESIYSRQQLTNILVLDLCHSEGKDTW